MASAQRERVASASAAVSLAQQIRRQAGIQPQVAVAHVFAQADFDQFDGQPAGVVIGSKPVSMPRIARCTPPWHTPSTWMSLARCGREAAQGKLDAGVERVLAVAGVFAFQLGHERAQSLVVALTPRRATSRASSTSARAWQCTASTRSTISLRRAGRIAVFRRRQPFLRHDLADQLDGVRPVQRAQFALASARVERRGQRFARGEDEPRARVRREKLAAEGEDSGEGVVDRSPGFGRGRRMPRRAA